jgi:hypothetical protein
LTGGPEIKQTKISAIATFIGAAGWRITLR